MHTPHELCQRALARYPRDAAARLNGLASVTPKPSGAQIVEDGRNIRVEVYNRNGTLALYEARGGKLYIVPNDAREGVADDVTEYQALA